MLLETGDVLLYKGDVTWYNFFTKPYRLIQFLIKIATFSPYAHAGIVVNDDPDKLTVGEALSKGFVVSDQMGWIDKQIDQGSVHVYRFDDWDGKQLTKKEQKQLVSQVKKMQGKGYDYKDILDIFLHILTGRKFNFGSADKYICSEAVSLAFTYIGINLVPAKFDDEVTPADLGLSMCLVRVKK